MDKPEKLLQDEIIELPEFLYESATTTNASLRCDNLQTTCPGCMGLPGQCASCEKNCQGCQGVSCQSCQCSTQSSQGAPPSSSGEITINSSDITDTTITVHLKAIPGATSYDIAYRPVEESTAQYKRDIAELSYTFTGLQSGTTYTFNYYGKNGYGTGPYTSPVTATTGNKRPSYFSWNAGLVAQKPATSLFSQGEDFPYITAANWNLFTNSINSVRLYKNLGPYSFSQAVSGKTELSAGMVNQSANAIREMAPSVPLPSEASSNITAVSAKLFNSLMDSLNSIN